MQTISAKVIYRLRRKMGRPVGWLAHHAGYDIAFRDYYSPIPDLSNLPDSVWTDASSLDGIELDLQQQMTFVEQELSPFISEFHQDQTIDEASQRFDFNNGSYESVDAETLYAMVRLLRPKRIIELGSGYSTQIISQARARNQVDGAPACYSVIDPYASTRTRTFEVEVEDLSATEVPLAWFRELRSNDVLFVDTTHTVKLASDVNFIILEVLPILAPGVVVHFHDIFLPWSYPRDWLIKSRRFWAEQYLLQAFLAFNREFELQLAAYALSRTHTKRLEAVVPSFHAGIKPGAFWLRRAA